MKRLVLAREYVVLHQGQRFAVPPDSVVRDYDRPIEVPDAVTAARVRADICLGEFLIEPVQIVVLTIGITDASGTVRHDFFWFVRMDIEALPDAQRRRELTVLVPVSREAGHRLVAAMRRCDELRTSQLIVKLYPQHDFLASLAPAAPHTDWPLARNESETVEALRVVIGVMELSELFELRAMRREYERTRDELAVARRVCPLLDARVGDWFEHHAADPTYDFDMLDRFEFLGRASGDTKTREGWFLFRWLNVGRGICSSDTPDAGLNGGMRDAIGAWPLARYHNYNADGSFDDREIALPAVMCWGFRPLHVDDWWRRW